MRRARGVSWTLFTEFLHCRFCRLRVASGSDRSEASPSAGSDGRFGWGSDGVRIDPKGGSSYEVRMKFEQPFWFVVLSWLLRL